jgi:hypothetical protein
MEDYRKWTDALLRDEYQKAPPNTRQQLHASLALLPVDRTQVEYLHGRLLEAEPREVPVIRTALAAHQAELVERLWRHAADLNSGQVCRSTVTRARRMSTCCMT